MTTAGETTTFSFSAGRSDVPLVIIFLFQPDAIGAVRGRVALDGQAAEFSQFVYP